MIRRFIKDNSSGLLVVGASVGVLSTAYWTARASFQAARVLNGEDIDPHIDTKEQARLVWRLYIPAGVSGATTVLLIAGLHRVDAGRIAAASTALAVSQRAYESYRDQVVEELGEKKDQIFRAKVVEKDVAANPSPAIVAGSGTVLCYESFTGRYLQSDMATLNKAVNEINAKMLKHDYATLDDFYYLIGLNTTQISGQTGWEAPKLLELEFSSIINDSKPCLAFDYNYVKTF